MAWCLRPRRHSFLSIELRAAPRDPNGKEKMAFQIANDPRNQRLEVRVTPAEKLVIQNAATARGRSVSEFIVQRALQRPGFDHGEWSTLHQLRDVLEALQYLTTHHDDRSVEQLEKILSGVARELKNVWQSPAVLPLPETAGD
jgi:hypothetical protein